jgi:hypothetical protein
VDIVPNTTQLALFDGSWDEYSNYLELNKELNPLERLMLDNKMI